jgi:hypothetical protein
VTPIVGMRVGASITRGGWQRAGESPFITTDRSATVATVEADLSFRYTRVTGEWVRDVLETSTGDRVASGWYVQGQQTLTPRWFVAGRVEHMAAPGVFWLDQTGTAPPVVRGMELDGFEGTIGYRLTPELAIRGSHRARRGFDRSNFDRTVAVSLVWWKRWL